MEYIYKSAPVVLVLDQTLLQTTTKGMCPEEVGLRIMCSVWARRLWTLQEGSFQSRVHYLFADDAYLFNELHNAVRKRHAFPDRQRSVTSRHFLNELLDNPPNCYSDISPLKRHAHKALNCSWMTISLFFKEMDVTYHFDAYNIGGPCRKGEARVRKAIRTVMSRTTSKLEDESLVFMTLTELWAGEFRYSDMLAKDPRERYKAYFPYFDSVPGQMIFLDLPRHVEDGFHWLPTSFLSRVSPRSEPLPFATSSVSQREVGFPTSQGISVRYPGFGLTSPHNITQLPERFACYAKFGEARLLLIAIFGAPVHMLPPVFGGDANAVC